MSGFVALPLAATAYTRDKADRKLTHIVNLSAPVFHWQAMPICKRAAASSVLRDAAIAETPDKATCKRCRDAFDFVRGGPK